jgi:hypothetical protein
MRASGPAAALLILRWLAPGVAFASNAAPTHFAVSKRPFLGEQRLICASPAARAQYRAQDAASGCSRYSHLRIPCFRQL